jgi:hypothetical protein
MQVAYITEKLFADGSHETRIKINNEITPATIAKAIHTRRINKIKREIEQRAIIDKIKALRFYDENYTRKYKLLSLELRARNQYDYNRSARRARQTLYDICKCNDFSFFVTLTFDGNKIDRMNDNATKRKYSQWANDVKKQFPNMYYVTVPEYHKKGGLHFHILIGGITLDELKATPALNKRGKQIHKKGKAIWNIGAWKKGFSTLSIIGNGEATKHYICKYITKQHADDRFFNKRRYYVSRNIERPEIEKRVERIENALNGIDTNVELVSYLDPRKKFAVFTHDGNGIVNAEQNSAEVIKDVQELCARKKGAHGCERHVRRSRRAFGRAVRYSTIRTLKRKTPFSEIKKMDDSEIWIYANDKSEAYFIPESELKQYDPYEIGLLDD